jgi:hypothetical protein
MKWNGWEKIPLTVADASNPLDAPVVEAIAPQIVSASRSTDIPAFYGDWFIARLNAGYVKWKSPFGGSPVYVSFARTRLFVFWSKNPGPFLRHLDCLDQRGFLYYFLYTLNDYDMEGLEPGVPSCEERIRTFECLSRRIGKGRVVWRFDPLVISDKISVQDLLDKIQRIGDRIAPFTERLVFSFINIEKYVKVQRNLERQGFVSVREFTDDEIEEFCTGLATLNEQWGLTITVCGERRDLSRYGIGRGQCISFDLITQQFRDDRELMEFLHPACQQTLAGTTHVADPSRHLKDPGQRNTCRCIVSKDIGQYSTCMHLCAYCYANTSPGCVSRNHAHSIEEQKKGLFHDSILE